MSVRCLFPPVKHGATVSNCVRWLKERRLQKCAKMVKKICKGWTTGCKICLHDVWKCTLHMYILIKLKYVVNSLTYCPIYSIVIRSVSLASYQLIIQCLCVTLHCCRLQISLPKQIRGVHALQATKWPPATGVDQRCALQATKPAAGADQRCALQ